jgi:hypothetical protein
MPDGLHLVECLVEHYLDQVDHPMPLTVILLEFLQQDQCPRAWSPWQLVWAVAP